ncbi:MAG TPA: type I phosphomannose isomerase catalytic subunit [Bryobacteraceae bacterium]|jgi:mannose-6-phosphate isomerase
MPVVRLKPRFVERVWGSEHLGPWFNVPPGFQNTGAKIGEVWFEGSGDLPLLVKFLFTSGKLSVQVHPDDAYAAQHHNSLGKTEMWHVLAAEPGAQIAAGFREPVSADRLRAAALSGEIEELLAWHDARPGDTFFIPAGTVHAIGAGLTLCEIQQLSDVTYRLYDYGRPRELHLDQSLAVSHLGPHSARVKPEGMVLVSCEHFTVARYECSGKIEFHRGADGLGVPDVLIVIEGEGHVGGALAHCGEAWYAAPGTSPFEVTGRLTLLGAWVLPKSPMRNPGNRS